MEEEMEAVRGEMREIEDRIADLECGAPVAAALKGLLQPLSGGMREMSLADRKAVLQSLIGGIGVNRIEPESEEDGEEERSSGLRIRTRRLSVNIHLKAKTPESRDSGGCAGVSVNRSLSGSYSIRTGSVPKGQIRVSATVKAWGDLDASRWSDGFELCLGEPPEERRDEDVVVRIPRVETVEERAVRYMSMLTSGVVGSRAELARRIGVSRSYITKVMRRLPAGG